MNKSEILMLLELWGEVRRLSRQVGVLTQLLRANVSGMLDLPSAALYLGYSKSRMYKLAAEGKVPCHRLSRKKIMFKIEELDEWAGKFDPATEPRGTEGGELGDGSAEHGRRDPETVRIG